jgi:hypothetical protein
VKAEQTVFHLEADNDGQGYVDVVLICLSLYPILGDIVATDDDDSPADGC